MNARAYTHTRNTIARTNLKNDLPEPRNDGCDVCVWNEFVVFFSSSSVLLFTSSEFSWYEKNGKENKSSRVEVVLIYDHHIYITCPFRSNSKHLKQRKKRKAVLHEKPIQGEERSRERVQRELYRNSWYLLHFTAKHRRKHAFAVVAVVFCSFQLPFIWLPFLPGPLYFTTIWMVHKQFFLPNKLTQTAQFFTQTRTRGRAVAVLFVRQRELCNRINRSNT